MWHRHFLDSAQLFPLIPAGARVLVDIGSGAGFPGLVLSLMGVAEVHLVESDQRKAAFLREAARISGAKAIVHAQRSEEMAPIMADVVTARAVAPLVDLLGAAEPFIAPGTLGLFLKGQNVDEELTVAHKIWRIASHKQASCTDADAVILCVREVKRVREPAGSA
jgi:16S rRNA (guanine527-N7)-methyltransferase